MSVGDRGSDYRTGYPEQLSFAEEKLVNISRKARAKLPLKVEECTGVGLSGGGIRSATFCLGVFQGLATHKLLANIDFISTVSGGGYFGSFYSRFFMRKEVPDFPYVEETLTPCTSCGKGDAKNDYQRNVVDWLRENGRYLSPRGSGDILLAGAVLLRNWIVVQVVIVIFCLLLFLTAQLLRIPMDTFFEGIGISKEFASEIVVTLPGKLKLWVSPFAALPCTLFAFWAVPLGWAYWMVGRVRPKTGLLKRPATGLAFVGLTALLLTCLPVSEEIRFLALGMMVVSGLTSYWSCRASSRHASPAEVRAAGKYLAAYQDELARHWVSTQLKVALVTTLVALAFVAVDSLGQTIYLVLLTKGATLEGWGIGVLGLLTALSPFATRIMITSHGANVKRPKSFTKIAATAAAFLLVASLLTAVCVGANAIGWGMQRPANSPAQVGRKPLLTLSETTIVPDASQPNSWRIDSEEDPESQDTAPFRDTVALWAAWGMSLILSFLFGQSWPFLNRSTQLSLYSARLIRAYLGASNARRFADDGSGQKGGAVTDVIPGDDIGLQHYWPWPPPREETPAEPDAEAGSYRKGTPLHLVNVTINETLDGKSQVQQQDRKGIGMALGPAGISAGVRHHVVFSSGKTIIFPEKGFRMFDYRGEAGPLEFTGERLSLGQWLSISGAAFTTGLGARTSLALSLLAGIGNIRLGYWWDSGIEPKKRPLKQKPLRTQQMGALFTRLFPVQSYLLDEFTARYHGTARRHWYLSDGGHFENMGGYELIRRRLRLIVIIDAEADPDYNFGGLADLVRKARIDFAAEIEFLDEQGLGEIMPAGYRHCFSALENLRRGKWVAEDLPISGSRQTIDPVDHLRFSLAHAAIARVRYDCRDEAQSCLIYLKPTLNGDEPLDVLQYHVENPSFPQQTTADQFFDEAQWESYRALGEHVARQVFKAPEGEDAAGWWDALINRVLEKPTVGREEGAAAQTRKDQLI